MSYTPTAREQADARLFNSQADGLKREIGGTYPANSEEFARRSLDWFIARGHGDGAQWLVDNLVNDQYVTERRNAG